MPKIPVAQHARINPEILSDVGIVDPANAPGRDIVDALGAGVTKVAKKYVQMKGATAIARNQREGYEISQDLYKELKGASREDDDFAENAVAELEKRLGGLDEGMSRFVPQTARDDIEKTRQQYIKQARSIYQKEQSDAIEAAGLDEIDLQINVLSARAESDPMNFGDTLDELDGMMGNFFGTLTQDQIRDKRAGARADVIEATIAGMLRKGELDGAERLIRSGGFDADLDPTTRSRILISIDTTRKEAERLERQADADAEKLVKDVSNERAEVGFDRILRGGYTLEDLLSDTPSLTLSDTKAVRAFMRSEAGGEDDPESVLRLEEAMEAGDIAGDLAEAFGSQRLSQETFLRLRGTNRQLNGDDRPGPPFRSVRKALRDTMSVSDIVDADIRLETLTLRNDAVKEFELFAREHPDASRDDLEAKSSELVRAFARSPKTPRNRLRRPTGFAGSKSAVEMKDVEKAARLNAEAFDAGELSDAEVRMRQRVLDQWMEILETKAQADEQEPRR